MVVLVPPPDAQLTSLGQVREALRGQELVPQPAVEALGVGVLPRSTGLDVQRLDAGMTEEPTDLLGDELRAVVAADVLRCPADRHQLREHVQHVGGLHRAGNLQHQRLAGELVLDHKPTQRPAPLVAVVYEVPDSHVVDALGSPPPDAVGRDAQPTLLDLLHQHPAALPLPEPVEPLEVDPPAVGPQQGPDPPVAEPWVLADQRRNRPQQRRLVAGLRGLVPLRAPRLAHHPADPSLADPVLPLDGGDAVASPGRAHPFPSSSM